MNKVVSLVLIFLFAIFSPFGAIAENDHDDSGHKDGDEKKKSGGDSHSHENESHSSEGNAGKAILEIEDDGSKFKLSSLAIKSIKLKYKKCEKLEGSKIKIPQVALVSFGNEFGVFVHRSDWFELVEVKVVSQSENSRIVSAPYFSNIKAHCEIVVSGVPLLRIAQLEASGEGGEGHAH